MRDFYDSVASPKATLIASKISNCNAPRITIIHPYNRLTISAYPQKSHPSKRTQKVQKSLIIWYFTDANIRSFLQNRTFFLFFLLARRKDVRFIFVSLWQKTKRGYNGYSTSNNYGYCAGAHRISARIE